MQKLFIYSKKFNLPARNPKIETEKLDICQKCEYDAKYVYYTFTSNAPFQKCILFHNFERKFQ